MTEQPAQPQQNNQPSQKSLSPQKVYKTAPSSNLTSLLIILTAVSLGAVGFLGYQNYKLQNQVSQLVEAVNKKDDLGTAKESAPAASPSVSPQPPAENNAGTDTESLADDPVSPTSTQVQEAEPTPDPYQDWLSYTNTEYGFQISYPDNYEALDDENNLYGWPNGVMLLHGGGQAYDVVVEAWDSEQEYLEKYPGGDSEVMVEQINDKYITVHDNTNQEKNSEIIDSFQEL